jgi:hypothetical protein
VPEDASSTGSPQPLQFSAIPTLYADGIANIARGGGVVRTYLIRFDPSLTADPAAPKIIGQMILPVQGFVAMALFFKAQLDDMIEKKEITPELLERVRQMVPGSPNAT